VAGSAVFDPEIVGLVLQRMPAWIPLAGRGTDDFQDLALWRRLSVLGIRAARAVHRTVVVPMAFSNLAYLGELTCGVAKFDASVRHFCLIAPLSVVLERLAKRGGDLAHPSLAWQVRRARECCAAHQAAEFGEHIRADDRTPAQIASVIAARL
jgi:hypothetical protein